MRTVQAAEKDVNVITEASILAPTDGSLPRLVQVKNIRGIGTMA
jgi:hypothetical protein